MNLKPWIKGTFLVGIALALVLWQRSCSNYKSRLADTTAMLDSTELRFEQFKTESGLNAASAREQAVSYEILIASKSREIEKLRKELKFKPKNIRELVYVTLEGKDSVVLVRDTTYVNVESTPETPEPFVYEDKWNSFQAFVSGGEIGLLYSITDSLAIVTTEVPGKWFKRGYSQVQAMSSNPAITITGLSSTVIEDPKVGRWSVGPYIGVGIDEGLRPVANAGVGVQFAFLRF